MGRLVVVAVDSPACSLRCLVRSEMFRDCLIVSFDRSEWVRLLIAASLYSDAALPMCIGVDMVFWVYSRWISLERARRKVRDIVERLSNEGDVVCVDCGSYRGLAIASELASIKRVRLEVAKPVAGRNAIEPLDHEIKALAKNYRDDIDESFREAPLPQGGVKSFIALKNELKLDLSEKIKRITMTIINYVSLAQIN